MELLTPLETICRLILRAKEMEAQVPSAGEDETADDVDDFDDEGDQALSVLDDELNESVEEEVRTMIDDLADDQLAEILALAWVGRGTYDASEWDEAYAEAGDLRPDERDRRAARHAIARRPSRGRPRRLRLQLRGRRPDRLNLSAGTGCTFSGSQGPPR